METVKDVSQIIYYLSLEHRGHPGVGRILQGQEPGTGSLTEYNIYNELDNRFFEYQKLALEYYDLDILDVPNNDPSLGSTRSGSRRWWRTRSCSRCSSGRT